MKKVLIGLATILVVGLIGWLVYVEVINFTTYKAVFMTNGQVYFGKVYNEWGTPLVLRDIYYLQVQQSLQGQDQNKDNSNQQIQLIKLGNEIHGPQDQMRINRDQILYIEDLKDDSQVVKTIKNYQKNGGQTITTSSSPTQSENK